jgi:hypothetical protein
MSVSLQGRPCAELAAAPPAGALAKGLETIVRLCKCLTNNAHAAFFDSLKKPAPDA